MLVVVCFSLINDGVVVRTLNSEDGIIYHGEWEEEKGNVEQNLHCSFRFLSRLEDCLGSQGNRTQQPDQQVVSV